MMRLATCLDRFERRQSRFSDDGQAGFRYDVDRGYVAFD